MLDPVHLDVIGALEGNDKASTIKSPWDYLRQYEPLFEEFRDDPINLLEVGLAEGSSLKLWKWFFRKAIIVGIDIAERCAAFAQERVVIEIGSQADRDFITRVCRNHPPTLFIDDGSHLAEHNIITFETVFPHLMPGGLYIVEDLAFHFGKQAGRWQSAVKSDAPGYFLDLARHRLSMGRGGAAPATDPKIARTVESVTFIGSAAIIRKTRPPRDTEQGVRAAEAYFAEHEPTGQAHVRLAGWLLAHDGSLARAQQALDDAARLGVADGNAAILRARILRLNGCIEEAAALLDAAVEEADRMFLLRRLAAELALCSAFDSAIRAAQKSAALWNDDRGADEMIAKFRQRASQ